MTAGLAASLATYGGLTPVFSGYAWGSDHYPFGARGFPSALLIESNWTSNPNYHKASDTVDLPGYIDYAYAAAMTRGAVVRGPGGGHGSRAGDDHAGGMGHSCDKPGEETQPD